MLKYHLLLPILVLLISCSSNGPDVSGQRALDTIASSTEKRLLESEYADSVKPLAALPSTITDALKQLRNKEQVNFPEGPVLFRKINHRRLLGDSGDYLQVIESGYRFKFRHKTEVLAIEYWLFDKDRVHKFQNTKDYGNRFYVSGYFNDETNSATFHPCDDGSAIVIRYAAHREFRKDYDVIRGFLLDCGCYGLP